MLDVRRLRVLAAVSRHGSIAAAARALGYSGPAVSQQIAALEREIAVPLTERRGRSVALTAAADILVAHADVLFAQLDAAESDIARFKGQAGGLVKVAAFPSAAAAFLPHAWSSVAAASTQVQVEFEEMEPEESLAALLNHEIDIAIAHAYDLLPRPLGVAFDVRTLLDEPVLLAVSTLDQPLTGSIDLSSVAQQPFIVPRDGTSCAEMVQRACARAGFVPQVAARATDFAVQLELVAAGLGVALVPNLATRRVPHGVRLLRPLEPITRNIFTVSVRGGYGKPAVRVVVDALEAAAKHGHRREQLLT